MTISYLLSLLPAFPFVEQFYQMGQEVQVRISDINTDNNTVNLSMVPAGAYDDRNGGGGGGYGKRTKVFCLVLFPFAAVCLALRVVGLHVVSERLHARFFHTLGFDRFCWQTGLSPPYIACFVSRLVMAVVFTRVSTAQGFAVHPNPPSPECMAFLPFCESIWRLSRIARRPFPPPPHVPRLSPTNHT